MKDLTRGPIRGLIVAMAVPIAIGMLVQTAYFLVDLYFVSRLGSDALAGVTTGGNAVMLVMALTQMLSVGTVALMSHAVGAKDQPRAHLIFNQSLGLAMACSAFALILGWTGIGRYMDTLGAAAAISDAGRTYLMWYLPGLALQFPLAAMGSAMRATGIAMPAMVVQMLCVLVNMVLAPVLIAGWGTGHALGVAGAGLASSLAVAAGIAMMLVYYIRLERYVSLDFRAWWPRGSVWGPLLRIGVPAGGEFALLFVYTAVLYWLVRGFGAAAQAGVGLGLRLMQVAFMPALAISFAVPAVAGQNFGARRAARVRATLTQAVILEWGVMLLLAAGCHWAPAVLVSGFTQDLQVSAVAVEFLRIVSANFVAAGFVFACSGIFQALGNTWPAMVSTASRLITFVLPALWLAHQPGFALKQLWYLSVVTVLLQAIVSGFLVRAQLRRRLAGLDDAAPAGTASAPMAA
jgi:putative MATE family efflux protein